MFESNNTSSICSLLNIYPKTTKGKPVVSFWSIFINTEQTWPKHCSRVIIDHTEFIFGDAAAISLHEYLLICTIFFGIVIIPWALEF